MKKDKRKSKITLVGVVKNNISTKNIIKKKTYQLRNWQRVYFLNKIEWWKKIDICWTDNAWLKTYTDAIIVIPSLDFFFLLNHNC